MIMRNSLSSGLLIAAILISSIVSAQSYNNLFFVFLNSNPDKTEISKQEVENLQAKHLATITQLADEGIMKAAGPFEGGGGMFIMDAEDIISAKEILNSDAAIAANRYKLEVFPVMIANNHICGAKEPYKMVNYQFVRLINDPEFFGDSDALFRENRVFYANLNNNNDFVVAQGNFNQNNDGFILLDVATANEAQAIIDQHPAVIEGQLKTEIKTLYIAEGTFCKK